jgi:hypothetical protein
VTSGAPSAGGEILDPRMRVERMETEVAVRLFFIWMACYIIIQGLRTTLTSHLLN